MLFAIQRVGGETRRNDRVATGKPCPADEKQSPEKQCGPNLGDTNHWTGTVIDGRNDLEISLQPNPNETDDREAKERRRKCLGPDAEQADEWNHEDEEEDGDADRPPRPVEPIEDEVRL